MIPLIKCMLARYLAERALCLEELRQAHTLVLHLNLNCGIAHLFLTGLPLQVQLFMLHILHEKLLTVEELWSACIGLD